MQPRQLFLRKFKAPHPIAAVKIAEYTAFARSTLADKIDAIDDLYTVSLDLGNEYRAKDGLHYNEDGARYLADAVCRFLKDQKYI